MRTGAEAYKCGVTYSRLYHKCIAEQSLNLEHQAYTKSFLPPFFGIAAYSANCGITDVDVLLQQRDMALCFPLELVSGPLQW